VVDGGSADDTIAVATALGGKVVSASRGRARQMNAGAAAATGEHLLFLHADTDPPEHFPELVSTTLDQAVTGRMKTSQ
jgi:glycosyltransferase involved in cell wall biosynthesis